MNTEHKQMDGTALPHAESDGSASATKPVTTPKSDSRNTQTTVGADTTPPDTQTTQPGEVMMPLAELVKQIPPRFNPKHLPLVNLLRIIKKLTRARSMELACLTYPEMMGICSTVCALDSVGQFGFYVLHRIYAKNPKATIDELYAEYVQFCAANACITTPKHRFKTLMHLGANSVTEHTDHTGIAPTGE